MHTPSIDPGRRSRGPPEPVRPRRLLDAVDSIMICGVQAAAPEPPAGLGGSSRASVASCTPAILIGIGGGRRLLGLGSAWSSGEARPPSAQPSGAERFARRPSPVPPMHEPTLDDAAWTVEGGGVWMVSGSQHSDCCPEETVETLACPRRRMQTKSSTSLDGFGAPSACELPPFTLQSV
jgi:hypothetical protein